MSHRRHRAGSLGSIELLSQQYALDDANLDAIGRGEIPNDDTLWQTLAAARAEVNADMPAPPTVADLGMAGCFHESDDTADLPMVITEPADMRRAYNAGTYNEYADFAVPAGQQGYDNGDHATAEQMRIDEQEYGDAALVVPASTTGEPIAQEEQLAPVVPIRRYRLASGLIGAAAATLVIAGGGIAIQSAEPGSPFYGLREAVFGPEEEDKSAVYMELASALEEAQAARERGDEEEAQNLLNIASNLAAQLGENQAEVSVTVPSTVFVETPSSKASPVTETQTSEVTVTQTETVEVTVTTTVPQEVSEPTSVVTEEAPVEGVALFFGGAN